MVIGVTKRMRMARKKHEEEEEEEDDEERPELIGGDDDNSDSDSEDDRSTSVADSASVHGATRRELKSPPSPPLDFAENSDGLIGDRHSPLQRGHDSRTEHDQRGEGNGAAHGQNDGGGRQQRSRKKKHKKKG